MALSRLRDTMAYKDFGPGVLRTSHIVRGEVTFAPSTNRPGVANGLSYPRPVTGRERRFVSAPRLKEKLTLQRPRLSRNRGLFSLLYAK